MAEAAVAVVVVVVVVVVVWERVPHAPVHALHVAEMYQSLGHSARLVYGTEAALHREISL